MATTTITGNAAAAPDLRFTAAGQPVANFTVVENRRKRDASGQWVDDAPLFMRCTAWGDLAQHVASSVDKGTRITVHGRIVPRSYEKDGETRRTIEVVADDVALSLRFAAAQVVGRAHRTEAGGDDDPWSTAVDTVSDTLGATPA